MGWRSERGPERCGDRGRCGRVDHREIQMGPDPFFVHIAADPLSVTFHAFSYCGLNSSGDRWMGPQGSKTPPPYPPRVPYDS